MNSPPSSVADELTQITREVKELRARYERVCCDLFRVLPRVACAQVLCAVLNAQVLCCTRVCIEYFMLLRALCVAVRASPCRP